MQEYIVKKAQQNLEAYLMDWAHNFYAKAYVEKFGGETDDSKLKIAAADKNMEELQAKIDFCKEFIKENS